MPAVVARIRVCDHPTRPDYQVGLVAGRRVVTGRHYVDGQVGVFISEGCVVPEALLREMWLWNDAQGKGRLGGKRGDRVKAKDMAGVRSEGLFYGRDWFDAAGVWHRAERWNPSWVEGDDVAAELGVTSPDDGVVPERRNIGWGRFQEAPIPGSTLAEALERDAV